MAQNRGKDTKPELLLRKEIWNRGGRYRTHPKDVPGRPDICNKRAKVAVFVDGCFWHGCPVHFKLPKTRTAFWKEKIRRNQERREQVLSQYDEEWTVFQYFECELAGRVELAASEILDALEADECI